MLANEFDYNLPQELIAQTPASPRDSSRLMIVDRKKQTTEHRHFFDIIDYLKAGDLIVWNNSKVFKARLFGKLTTTGDQELFEHKKPIEIFLVRPMENEGVWKVLAKPGRHVKPGMRVRFSPSASSGQAPDFYCDVVVKEPNGEILVQFPDNEETVRQKANRYGHIPVPPYVKDEPHELESYQTVYAKHEGSVAAPTAGFHFTPDLIQKLKNKGVDFAEITLHIGLGTFLPVKSERVEDHTMHSEWVELDEENAEKIDLATKEGKRIIAVGTTTVRTLEGIFRMQNTDSRIHLAMIRPYKGDINIFIKPGFKFQVVDAMITNFHLPKSTLLMLVSAFASSKLGYGVTQSAFAEATADKSAFAGDRLASRSLGGGREFMLECYQRAVEERYRFYSFGDAMLIE